MGVKTRRTEHAADTKNALIRAARRLFGQDGYRATSLDDICRRARVTKGALYHHFHNKEDLFAAVLEQIEDEFVQAGTLAHDPDADIWDGLRAAARSYLDACTRSDISRVIVEAPAVLGWQRCRELESRHRTRVLRALLEDAATDRGTHAGDPNVLAHLLVALFNEAGMIVAEANNSEAARNAATAELDSILAGLQARGTHVGTAPA